MPPESCETAAPVPARANGWHRVLILGGIRSGKSELAEAMVASAATGSEPAGVVYVATALGDPTDPAWEQRIEEHRARRPGGWATREIGSDPSALAALIEGAAPQTILLVDDVGGWLAALMSPTTDATTATITHALVRHGMRLAAAVATCPGRLVLVSPEVGLSLVPATAAGRAFADALGRINRAIAAECDTVTLVIAGNAMPVKGGP